MRRVLLALLVVPLVLDVITTEVALTHFGAQEANPVMVLIVASPLLHLALKLSFAGIVAYIALQCDRMIPDAGKYPLIAAVLFYILPVLCNGYQLLQVI